MFYSPIKYFLEKKNCFRYDALDVRTITVKKKKSCPRPCDMLYSAPNPVEEHVAPVVGCAATQGALHHRKSRRVYKTSPVQDVQRELCPWNFHMRCARFCVL